MLLFGLWPTLDAHLAVIMLFSLSYCLIAFVSQLFAGAVFLIDNNHGGFLFMLYFPVHCCLLFGLVKGSKDCIMCTLYTFYLFPLSYVSMNQNT